MISRNSGHAMVGIFVRIIPIIVGKVSPSSVRGTKSFFQRCSHLMNTQGVPGLVAHLKAASVQLQQSLAGHKSVLPVRVSRTNSGIPRIIPAHFRHLIRSSHTKTIKLSLTLLSVFRDLIYPSKVKTGTITDHYKGTYDGLKSLHGSVGWFNEVFINKYYPQQTKYNRRELLKGTFKYTLFFKSSPQSFGGFISSHPVSMIRSALALSQEMIDDIIRLFGVSGEGVKPRIHLPIYHIRQELSQVSHKVRYNPYLGKLGLKQEAAGKMRVFAMVDPWTQLVLRPFHNGLFKILRNIPMDGTFNQLEPLKMAWKVKNPLFSMDLSSATDRLPIDIQVELIKKIFSLSDEEAQSWRNLLVGRGYYLPTTKELLHYSVGQPMGALSSWAMLAITHHFIVQVAALNANILSNRERSIFKQYAVLGDDIVIFNAKVAKEYKKILESIGVECNMNKSIISPKGDTLEFAKKTLYHGIDVSPIPLKEISTALKDPVELFNFAYRHDLKESQVFRLAGFGYRVIGSLSKPFYKQNFKIRYYKLVELMHSDHDRFVESFRFIFRSYKLDLIKQGFIHMIYDMQDRLYNKVSTDVVRLSRISAEIYYKLPELEGVPKVVIFKLWAKITGPVIEKFTKSLLEGQHSIAKTVVRLERDIYSNNVSISKYLFELLRIRALLGSYSVDLMYLSQKRDKALDINKQDKILQYRLIEQMKTGLLVLSKKLGNLPNEPEALEELHFNEVVTRSSGFNPFALIRPTTRLVAAFSIKRAIRLFFYRRVIWLSSFTGLLSLITYFKGVVVTATLVFTIWSGIQSLIMIDLPSPFDKLVQYCSNILLHTVELYVGMVLVTAVTHYDLWSSLITLDLDAMARNDLSFFGFSVDMIRFSFHLIWDLAHDTVTAINSYTAGRDSFTESFLTFSLGYGLSTIIVMIIKWII